ncbi:MAG: hypothetical protein D6754_11515 [Alphaproteobacteria bacterium]|nr:MAG: hypothetical protein D6754_11515 [Alphaproteobacteria bacterium]
MPERSRSSPCLTAAAFLLGLLAWLSAPAFAQGGFFAPGWTLVPEASSLKFQSVKNVSVIETSSFATFSGRIEPNGAARVEIALESVDTGIDLRNVRMRFLFFETFRYPLATVTLQLDPDALGLRELPQIRRMPMKLDYTLDLHGVQKTLQADVVVTFITDGLVSVASSGPIPIKAADFNLTEGINKLQDAAKVTITPAGSVSFDFIFRRDGPAANETVAAAERTEPAPAAPATPKSAALEPEGNLSREACAGRFEILSRTGAIYFAPGSARLDSESVPLLREVIDIVQRCPGFRIEVQGHTDSIGSDRSNQRLSEARARAVAGYLIGAGIAPDRISSRGYGETRPVAPNDTRRNRALNRRIEFAVLAGG